MNRLIVLILLATALSVPLGCSPPKPKPKKFEIGISSIRVEGSVTDVLSPTVTMTMDGVPVSLDNGEFDETVDMAGLTGFVLEADDETGTTSTLTVDIE